MSTPEQNLSDSELVYHLNDKPAPHVAFLAAFQHLLAIIVPIITPGFLICLAIGVSPRDTNMILSMSLVISGFATYLQCRRFGPLGSGLLTVQGTSFNFVGPLIAGGTLMVKEGTPVETVMATIFGVVIAGAFIEMGVSRILPFIRRLITPLVTGIVVLIIGLTLIKEGLVSMGGGYAAMGDGTFANPQNLGLSCGVLLLIIIFNRLPFVWVRSCAIMLALVVGYIAAAFMGLLDFTAYNQAAYFEIPKPMHFGLSFSWSLFIPMVIIYLVTSLEAVGDITATSKISREPVEGESWMKRIKGGVLVNGFNSVIAGVFNTFPSSVFAQNNGIIQLTGVASRYVGIWLAAILVVMGLFPKIAGIFQAMPQAVLGGATIVMFGAVAASGINMLAGIKLDRRALLIIAISLAMGLGIAQVPEFFHSLPESLGAMLDGLFGLFGFEQAPGFIAAIPMLLTDVLKSGLSMGCISAVLLNIFIPENSDKAAAQQK